MIRRPIATLFRAHPQRVYFSRYIAPQISVRDLEDTKKELWNEKNEALDRTDGENLDLSKHNVDDFEKGLEHDREEAWAFRRDMDVVRRLHRSTNHASYETQKHIEKQVNEIKDEVKEQVRMRDEEKERQFKEMNKHIDEMHDMISNKAV